MGCFLPEIPFSPLPLMTGDAHPSGLSVPISLLISWLTPFGCAFCPQLAGFSSPISRGPLHPFPVVIYCSAMQLSVTCPSSHQLKHVSPSAGLAHSRWIPHKTGCCGCTHVTMTGYLCFTSALCVSESTWCPRWACCVNLKYSLSVIVLLS